MAEYSGEKELLGAGVAPEPMRRTGGALPPDTEAAKHTAKAYEEAAEARREAADSIDPANRPPAVGAPPVPSSVDATTAAPAGLGMATDGADRKDGAVTESNIPPNLQEAAARADAPPPAPEPAAPTSAKKK